MARISALVFASFVALAMVCSTTSAPVNQDVALLDDALGFSIAGVIKCLAMIGIAGLADVVDGIQRDCSRMGNNFAFRICALGKFAKLGPEYVMCAIKS